MSQNYINNSQNGIREDDKYNNFNYNILILIDFF